jgi:dipeptidyl aminopeptidase/acylaminoacyl peptidase
MNSDGTGDPTRLTVDADYSDGSPDWSPDGTQIVFSKYAAGSEGDIWVMNADGSGAQNVTSDAALDYGPSWSPDGTQIAFSRYVNLPSGPADIWVIGPDGSGAAPVVADAAASEGSPAWQRTATQPILETTDVQITSTSDYEMAPTLGQDDIGEFVVYTSFAVDATGIGPGEIMVQRLDAVGGIPTGPVVQVSDGTTDDQLNDVSGDHIVFAAYDPDFPLWGQIKLYDLATGTSVALMPENDTVREARIHGDIVVWTQGQGGDTRVNYYDLNWPSGMDPLTIGGPNPASYNVDIGSRYVVWEQFDGGQTDIRGYDIYGGDYVSISADVNMNESDPATFGEVVVWQSTDAAGNTTIELADLSVKPAVRYTLVDNGALVYAPSIHENIVAFEARASSTSDLDIYLARISDGKIFAVTASPDDQYLNNVFGDKIAYVDASGAATDIHVVTFAFRGN